eukprot:4254882-Amphidinium_carterae.1
MNFNTMRGNWLRDVLSYTWHSSFGKRRGCHTFAVLSDSFAQEGELKDAANPSNRRVAFTLRRLFVQQTT